MCRQGASVIQKKVLAKVNDRSVRVFVVWEPILGSDREGPTADTSALIPDRRVRQFWDPKRTLAWPFARALGLPPLTPAWDVYLIYPRGVKWEAEPPKPVYWQHQLGRVTDAPRLDGQAFVGELRKALGSPSKPMSLNR